MDKNPRFIVCGDIQQGWRIKQKFLNKENWLTWKMLIFPFYELYWLGNGFVGGVNWLRKVPDYGKKERRMIRNAVYEYTKQSEIDFMFIVGDMVADGRRPKHWEMFLKENKIEQPLLLNLPFLPVIGNHEKANEPTYGFPNYQAIFSYPRFYVLDFPDAALFVVDSNIIIDQYEFIDDKQQDELFEKWFVSENPEKPAWLERELASRQQPFKIVLMHHPPISFGKHYSDWNNSSFGNELKQKRKLLLNLFHKYGVQLVFCGHEHIYEHNILENESDKSKNASEIHFIVCGSAGAPLRSLNDRFEIERFLKDYRDEGYNVISVKQRRIYNYCILETSSDKITIQVIEVTEDNIQPKRLVEEIVVPRL